MDERAEKRRTGPSGGSYPPELRARAAEMRRRGLGKEAIADELGVHPKTLQGWFRVDGVAPVPPQRSPESLAREAALAERRAARVGRPHPGSTGHPPEVREQAAQMRRSGVTRAVIARRLEVGTSTVARWFREDGVQLNVDGLKGRAAAEAARRVTIGERWARQDAEQAAHAAAVGSLTERERLLIGAALYWAEGAKSKPWRRQHTVSFMNSDSEVLLCFIALLEQLGVSRTSMVCRLQIHRTADVEGAQQWWRALLGDDLEFSEPTLKKHVPTTVRHNTGEDYRGCLNIRVRGGATTYRRIVGTWEGVAKGFTGPPSPVV